MLVQASTDGEVDEQITAWGGVFAMALGAFALVASEFMPVSLLTPIAAELRVTEGVAGQSIAVSGAFALMTALSISSAAASLDRKLLMLSLTGLMIVAGTIAAFAPNYALFMVGRAFIGVAIGGFWSLSAATAMRLVPVDQVPKALAVVNGGNALAMVIAAPLGSFLGGLIGWRGASFFIVPIAFMAFLWQLFSLPVMPSMGRAASANVFRVLNRPIVVLGMIAVSLFFMGQFSLYTYVRPFLETVLRVDVTTLSLILLTIGVMGFIGTASIGFVLNNHLYTSLIAIPLVLAAIALSLIASGGWLAIIAVLLAFWGLFATAAPVAWWTWLAKTLPDDAEAGGGLMVAIIQLAIALGATLGGLLFDQSGYRATFVMSMALLVGSALVSIVAARSRRAV